MRSKNQIINILSDFPYHYKLNTRWKDMDKFSHVNNAVYLSYIEDARITFFERWNLSEKNRSIIVVSVKIDYLRQIFHPSNLLVGQKVSRIGKKSFDIKSAIFILNQGTPVAISVVTCVCFNYEENKSVQVFSEIKEDYNNN